MPQCRQVLCRCYQRIRKCKSRELSVWSVPMPYGSRLGLPCVVGCGYATQGTVWDDDNRHVTALQFDKDQRGYIDADGFYNVCKVLGFKVLRAL